MTWSLLCAVQYTPGRPFQLIVLVSVEGKLQMWPVVVIREKVLIKDCSDSRDKLH